MTSRLESLAFPGYIDSAGDGYLRAGGAFKRGHGAPMECLQSGEVFGACGAGFLIRRDVFDQLAGFDEDFFMVYEDVDLWYRARLAGHRCWYAADAIIRHAGSATLGTVSAQAVYYGQRNLEWTWLKNTPPGLLLRTLPEHLAYSLAGVAHYIAAAVAVRRLRGKVAALIGLPSLMRKRRDVQRERRVDSSTLELHLERDWIAVKRTEKARCPRPVEVGRRQALPYLGSTFPIITIASAPAGALSTLRSRRRNRGPFLSCGSARRRTCHRSDGTVMISAGRPSRPSSSSDLGCRACGAEWDEDYLRVGGQKDAARRPRRAVTDTVNCVVPA